MVTLSQIVGACVLIFLFVLGTYASIRTVLNLSTKKEKNDVE